MKITSAEFLLSVFDIKQVPSVRLPEIAFMGRSNVGKSSLLNSLLMRKGLARTSNTPGRTQSINYFLINSGIYFVDLPGYGYAKVSKAMRSDWGVLARDYLTDSEDLVLSLQLVDSRHDPTPLDLQLHEWLLVNDRESAIVLTKTDKLSNNALTKRIADTRKAFPESKIFHYSASTGRGREELWTAIEASLKSNK